MDSLQVARGVSCSRLPRLSSPLPPARYGISSLFSCNYCSKLHIRWRVHNSVVFSRRKEPIRAGRGRLRTSSWRRSTRRRARVRCLAVSSGFFRIVFLNFLSRKTRHRIVWKTSQDYWIFAGDRRWDAASRERAHRQSPCEWRQPWKRISKGLTFSKDIHSAYSVSRQEFRRRIE